VLVVVGLEGTGDGGRPVVEQPGAEGGLVGGDAEVLAGQSVVEEFEIGHRQ
jgi:hypothetical protein